MSEPPHRELRLDGHGLTLSELARVARDPQARVTCDPVALDRVRRGRRQIEAIAEAFRVDFERFESGESSERPVQDYGVTTGFGEFKDRPVSPDQLEVLQSNILLSHSVGVGESASADDPAGYFPAEVVRAALLIRLNAFLKGHSGVRPELVETVRAFLDRGIVPLVPVKGSVGSSGDLCALAHLFAVLLGEGRYYLARRREELGRGPREAKPAAELAADLDREPVVPSFKEGLALVNGATFSAALLALAVGDAESLANAADVAISLSLEAICGCARAFDPKIHAARGLVGQSDSAANVRTLVAGSRLLDGAEAVQDAYSLRCAPAVHGASRDAVAYAHMVVQREINAATDNPLFFPGEAGEGHDGEPWDFQFRGNWPAGYHGEQRFSYSAGNFHGQPLALAADFLAIAVAELADISERRIQMLLDHHHNRNLPANLIPRRGVNSGFMLAQYTSAALVSENKVLAHPASVDSIPTSANSEDHVAMATHAARKLRTVLANTQAVLAIELMVAAQAIEWRVGMERPPRRPVCERPSGDALEQAREAWRASREEAERFAEAVRPERRRRIAASLGVGTGAAYLAVRRLAEPMLADRPLDGDIRELRYRLEDRSLVAAVESELGAPLSPIPALVSSVRE